MAPSPWRLIAATGIAAAAIIIYSKRKSKKRSSGRGRRNDENEAIFLASNHMPSHLQRELYKERQRQKKIPDLARKTPMYDNVEMMDPSGTKLANISRKKAQWYVRKNLAKWTVSNTRIQLLFEPRAHSSGGYEKSCKENICVACGSSDGVYMRHYVVPYAYRQLLPSQYKSHLSHDVVILCPDCHLHCDQVTQMRMKKLEDGRPHKCRNVVYVNRELQQVKSAATALIKYRDQLPSEKVLEYETLVRAHLNLAGQEAKLSEQQLQEASSLDCETANPNYISGAEFVVRSLNDDDAKITRFIKNWRRHFLDSVQPKYLPKGWSVDAPVMSNVAG